MKVEPSGLHGAHLRETVEDGLLPTLSGCVCVGSASSGAIFSEDRAHRFLLWRRWDWRCAPLTVIGINPSTADHEANDPTITRVVERARRMGLGGVWMVNLGSLRSTDPRGLVGADWTGGDTNLFVLNFAATGPAITVAAWGGPYAPKALDREVELRASQVVSELRRRGTKLHVIALTKQGRPRHPLYLSYELEPMRWAP